MQQHQITDCIWLRVLALRQNPASQDFRYAMDVISHQLVKEGMLENERRKN
jgi:hypothetical protein